MTNNNIDILNAITGVLTNQTAAVQNVSSKQQADTLKAIASGQNDLLKEVMVQMMNQAVPAPPVYPRTLSPNQQAMPSASPVNQVLMNEPFHELPLAPPITMPKIAEVVPSELHAPPNTFDMFLRVVKPCEGCSFAPTCKEKSKVSLSPNCGPVTHQAKELTMMAGGMYIEVQIVESGNTMHTTFHAYKDGVFLGDLWAQTENKPARLILEKYRNQRVYLHTSLLKGREGAIFTGLVAEILRYEPLDAHMYQDAADACQAPFSQIAEPPAEEEEIILERPYTFA